VLGAVHLGQLGYGFVHQVFSGHVKTVGEVIDLLVSSQCLVYVVLDAADVPYDAGLLSEHLLALDSLQAGADHRCRLVAAFVLEQLFGAWQLPESVIFKRVPDDFDVTVPQVEEVATIWWQIRSDLDWVLIWPEYQVLLAYFSVDLDVAGLVLYLDPLGSSCLVIAWWLLT
jgi:hypothetical protein